MQGLSVAGESFSLVAVPLLVLHATGSVAQMGLVTGASGAAGIFAGMFAGTIADRVDRRTLMIFADAARACLFGIIPLVWLFSPQTWLLYVAVPFAAAFGMLFQVTHVTAVPNLVGSDQITIANGRLYSTQAVMAIAGMLLAGFVSGAFGPSTVLGVVAITFGLSATGMCFVRLRKSVQAERQHPLQDLVVGVKFLWKNPVLRAMTALLCFFVFLSLGLVDIMVYYVKTDLGRPDSAVGYAMATAALGSVIGALTVAPLRKTFGFGVCWISSHVLVGVAIILIGFTSDLFLISLLAMAVIFFMSIAAIVSMSLRQEIVPDHLLGRVTSSYWTLQRTLSPLGAAAMTAATAQIGVTQVLLMAGIGCVLVGLGAIATPIRLARPERVYRLENPHPVIVETRTPVRASSG